MKNKLRALVAAMSVLVGVSLYATDARAQVLTGTLKIKKPMQFTANTPTVNPPSGTSWVYVDSGTGKVCSWDSSGTINCAGGAGGSGITSLNGLTGATQTFVNDTNVTISSVGTAHTIVWSGTLAKARTLGTTVYTDQANTWSTGAQDMGAAISHKIPTAAGLAPTANGNIGYDSTANQYKFGVNGSTKIVAFSDSTFPESQITNLTTDLAAKAPLASPTFTGTTTIPALTLSGITGSTQCLHVNTSGVLSGTGSDCGSGGGITDPGSNGILSRTALNTVAARTLTGTASRVTITNGDGTAGNPTFDVGTNVLTSTVTPTTKQLAIANAADRTITYIDFPDAKYTPASNNVNGTGGIGWTCPNATPAVLLRAGTNNKDSLLSPWGATDVCYFRVHLPSDYDSTASIGVSIDLTSTDVTNAHTIIMQASSACAKGDGSTTDDVAFNAAQSFSTITLNANANRTWQATLSALTNTGCAAGGTLWVKISRTTDTATNVGVYGATVTIPRLLTVQAN